MMSRFEAWLMHLAAFAVSVTGLVYGWMRYFVVASDEFAVVNHPLEPHVLHGHVLTAPLLVFAAGIIWKRHVIDRWRSTVVGRLWTGRLLAVLLPPMAMSGYLLQVAVDPAYRRAWLVTHLASSAGFLVTYLVHQLRPRRRPQPYVAPTVDTPRTGHRAHAGAR